MVVMAMVATPSSQSPSLPVKPVLLKDLQGRFRDPLAVQCELSRPSLGQSASFSSRSVCSMLEMVSKRSFLL